MTFDDFYCEALSSWPPKDQRLGQHAFNLLHKHRPDLTDQVYGSGVDPFNDDDNLPAFWQWVQENWEKDQ